MKRKRTKEGQAKEIELSNEVKILESELRKQQLYNKLLEEVIRIDGMQTGIDWKKSLALGSHEYRAIWKSEHQLPLLTV